MSKGRQLDGQIKGDQEVLSRLDALDHARDQVADDRLATSGPR